MRQPPSPHLNLWKQQLGRVPDSVWQQTSLETLVLADNNLTELSEQIGTLQNLRMLDLGHNQLTRLPESLGNLTALSDFLYLHENKLTLLPQSLGQLTRLRYLNISDNRFAAFPEPISSMSSLVELRASKNELTFLPDSISNLSRLRELHLDDNGLTSLPNSIAELSELRHLDLRNNQLTSLPDSISNLHELRHLDLRNNRVSSLPDAFAGLHELRLLDLRSNPLTYLPASLASLPRLEKLDLRWIDTLVPPSWLFQLERRGCLIYRRRSRTEALWGATSTPPKLEHVWHEPPFPPQRSSCTGFTHDDSLSMRIEPMPNHRRTPLSSFALAPLLACSLLLLQRAGPATAPQAGSDASLFAAVCPVVYQLDETPANRGFHYIFYGNAFFINDQGYLLTAAHVFSNLTDAGQPAASGQAQILLRLPEAPPKLVKVSLIAKDAIHDVAILRATPNPFHTRFQVTFLSLSPQKAALGDPVLAEALRPSRLKDPHTFDAPREDRVPGDVLQYLSTPLDKGQPNAELLLFSHEVERGQSGAPVVSRDSHQVVGLVEGRWLHPASVPAVGADGKPSLTQGAAVPISYAIALLDQNHISWQSDVSSGSKEQKEKPPNN